MQACDRCHHRKSRCGGERPTCRQCLRANSQCIYTDRIRNAAVLAERLSTLEQRLKESEAEREALAAQLTISQSCDAGAAADRPSRADIVNEVSYFAATAAGDRPYLGSASGVILAHLVLPEAEENSIEAPEPSTAEAWLRETAGRGPVDLNSKSASEALPSELLAKKLVSGYLCHDHLRYPFLEPSFIHSVTRKIYTDRAFNSISAFEWFSFDMVLAIATLGIYKSSFQMSYINSAHYSRAMMRIKEVLRIGGLRSLQAILLLIQHRTNSSVQEASASLWHLVGIAARMVYELGLHREASYCDDMKPQTPQTNQQRALRRLTFWCVFAMDRVVSTTLGRPFALNADDFDVLLPPSTCTLMSSEGEDEGKLPIFLHIVQHMNVFGNMMRFLHGTKPINRDLTVLQQREHLLAELDTWRHSTTDLDQFFRNNPGESCFRSREWYEVLYHNAVLLALRPSPTGSVVLQDSATLQKIFDSSKKAVKFYAYLYESRKLNYSWITLHSVFVAGLSYLYSVTRHFKHRKDLANITGLLSYDPTAVEIVATTRACSNILVAVPERWDIKRRCHKVFDKLSDAVLAETIQPQYTSNDVSTSDLAPLSDSTTLAQHQNPVPLFNNPNQHWHAENSAFSNNVTSQLPTLDLDAEFQNCFGDVFSSYGHPLISDLHFQIGDDWPITSNWY